MPPTKRTRNKEEENDDELEVLSQVSAVNDPNHAKLKAERIESLQSFAERLFDDAMKFMEKHLESPRTEGEGDCWLISILADHEIKDRKLLRKFSDKQREDLLTMRRKAIVKFAAKKTESGNNFNTVCNWLKIPVPDETGDERSKKAKVKKAQDAVMRKLHSWMDAGHFGDGQQVMHSVTGWYLKRNILEISQNKNECRIGFCARHTPTLPLPFSSPHLASTTASPRLVRRAAPAGHRAPPWPIRPPAHMLVDMLACSHARPHTGGDGKAATCG